MTKLLSYEGATFKTLEKDEMYFDGVMTTQRSKVGVAKK